MKRSAPQIITVAILLLMVYPALVGNRHQASAELGSTPAPMKQLQDASKNLFLVFSINNIGYIDVCGCKRKKVRQGSITRRAAYIGQARYHHENLLLIDGGNTLFGPDDGKKKDFEKI